MSFSYRRSLAISLLLTLTGGMSAPASAGEPVAGALKTVSTADKTASVQIPAGWKLAKGLNGFIFVTGPNDERINLGALVVGKNATAGGSDAGSATFALPYSSSLKEKFTTIVQAGAAKSGTALPQITFASETPTKLSACSLFLGDWIAGSDSRKFEGALCSLPPDVLGYYKNLVFLARVPARLAAQDRPIVERIAQSYRVTPAMFAKMMAPYTATPPRAAGGTYTDPTGANCFDYNVIRESPPWEVPISCGGHMPG